MNFPNRNARQSILDNHSIQLSILHGRIIDLKEFCKHWLQHKEASINDAMKQTTDCIKIEFLEEQKKNEKILVEEIYSEIEKRIRVELKDMLITHRLELLEIVENSNEDMRD